MTQNQELKIYQKFCQKIIELVKEVRAEENIDLDMTLAMSGTSKIVSSCKDMFWLQSEPYEQIVDQYDNEMC